MPVMPVSGTQLSVVPSLFQILYALEFTIEDAIPRARHSE